MIPGSRDPFGDTQRPRDPTVTDAAEFAIHQVICDQFGVIGIMPESTHGAPDQLTRLIDG